MLKRSALCVLAAAAIAAWSARGYAQMVTQFSVPLSNNLPAGIAAVGSEIWFTEVGYVGRMTQAGSFTTYAVNTSKGCTFSGSSFVAGAPDRGGKIVQGPDGAAWFLLVSDSEIGRIASDGTITRFPLSPGCVDYQLSGLASGLDGALWFTAKGTNKIGRMTTSGAVTEFNAPAANAGLNQIIVGPDGNLWFSQTNHAFIGRITTSGVIAEFAMSSIVGALTVGPDGNIWYSSNIAGTNGKLGRVTPAGVATDITVPADSRGNTSSGGITVGPDNNIWFTETVSSPVPGVFENVGAKIARITTSGSITEFPHPNNDASPQGIVSLDGALWFYQLGQQVMNGGGANGNKIAKFTVPPYFPSIRIGTVYSTQQNATQSYLRIYNTSASAGTLRVTVLNIATAESIAQWTSPSIAPGASPQFGVATLEAAATQAFFMLPHHTLVVEPQFTGYVQHVYYRPGDGTIANASSCDRGITVPTLAAANVRSGLLATGFPSTIVVHNTGLSTSAATLSLHDASNGNLLGAYTTPIMASRGQASISIAAMEAAIGNLPAAGVYYYVVKPQDSFTGYLQHFVTNQQAGVVSDMSTMCAMTSN